MDRHLDGPGRPPRLTDDADTDDIIDALLPVLGGIVDRRIAARGAGGGTAWHDAGLETRHAWDRFAQARTPVETADTITALGNAVAQLSTWLPGYDHDTGTIVAPGEEPEGEDR